MKSKKAKMLKEKYRALQREYDNLFESSRLEIDALDESSRTAEELNYELQAKNEKLAETIAHLGGVIENQAGESVNYISKLSAAEETISRQAATIVNMGAVIDSQEETIVKQAASIANLNAEINRLCTFDLQKSKRIVWLEKENARQAATIDKLISKIKNQRARIAGLEALYASTERSNNHKKLQEKYDALRGQSDFAISRYTDLEFENEKHKARIAGLEKENAQLRGQLAQWLAVFALPEYSDPKTIGKFTTITVRGNDGSYTIDVIRDGYEGQR